MMFNKFRFKLKVSKKYDLLFGKNNWSLENYKRRKMHLGGFGNAMQYAVSDNYSIKIKDKSNCPNGHLSEEQIIDLQTDSKKKINFNDAKMLYRYNPSLYNQLINDQMIERFQFDLYYMLNTSEILADNFPNDPNVDQYREDAETFQKQKDRMRELTAKEFRKTFIEVTDD